jgi:hypothetical protein
VGIVKTYFSSSFGLLGDDSVKGILTACLSTSLKMGPAPLELLNTSAEDLPIEVSDKNLPDGVSTLPGSTDSRSGKMAGDLRRTRK